MTPHDVTSPRFANTSLPLSKWTGRWVPHNPSIPGFSELTPGAHITVIKRSPDGAEAARYPAIVRASNADDPWREVEAIWANRTVNVAGLLFEPGDVLREFFSPIHPFNAFAISTSGGTRKGWYGNVTYPAFLIDDAPTLVWHDLYLDIVLRADGTVHLLDDDELDAAPIPFSEPAMNQAIHAAREDLLVFIQSFGFPE